jgi:SAM-dependent methyltransferase
MLVLDVGCGPKFPYSLWNFFPNSEAIGADINSLRNITIRTDGQDLPFRNDTFDAVLCSHVLEHMLHDFKALNEISRVLKSQGILVLIVPNNDCHRQILFRPLADLLLPLSKLVAKALRKIKAGGRSGGLGFYRTLYYASPYHYREYKLDEVVHLVLRAKFKILNIELYGLLLPLRRFTPENIRHRLDRIKAGKYSHNIKIDAIKGSVNKVYATLPLFYKRENKSWKTQVQRLL